MTTETTATPTTRFVLNAPNIIDRIIAILIAASRHALHEQCESDQAFLTIMNELDEEKITTLNSLKRAKMCYFLIQLQCYGFMLDANRITQLSTFWPTSIWMSESDRILFNIWEYLCLRERGLPCQVPTQTPTQHVDQGEVDYLLSKLGKRPRPTTGDWALVP
jgi:hypothetical protein